MADIDVVPGPLIVAHADNPTGPVLAVINSSEMLFFWGDHAGTVGGDGSPPGGSGTEGVFCWRTTDQGATWALSGTVDVGGFRHSAFAIYYDRWTPGYTGTDLVCVSLSSADLGGAGVRYTEINAQTGAVAFGPVHLWGVGDSQTQLLDKHGVVRLANGDVFVVVYDGSAGSFSVFRQASGVPFTFSTAPESTVTSLPGGTPVWSGITDLQLLPSNNAGNFLMVGQQNGALRVYEWDQATTTWLFGQEIATGLRTDDNQISACMRHNDERIFIAYLMADDTLRLAAADTRDSGPGDIGVITVPSAGAINTPALMCVQDLGHLYCAYSRGVSVNVIDVFYKQSVNGGIQWETEVEFWVDAAGNIDRVHLPPSTRGNDTAFFQPVWFDDDQLTWRTNDANQFPVGGYRVGTPSQQQSGVSCSTGQESVSAGDSVQFIKGRFPNVKYEKDKTPARFGDVLWMQYSSNTGTMDTGDTIVGVTSGARATVFGFISSPTRIGVYAITSGPGGGKGTPFLPGEQIRNTTTGKTSTAVLSQTLFSTISEKVRRNIDVQIS